MCERDVVHNLSSFYLQKGAFFSQVTLENHLHNNVITHLKLQSFVQLL